MSAVDVSSEPLDASWDAFVDAAPGGHHLQTSLWVQVKAKHGWRAKRFTVRRDGIIVAGCQLLVRRLPLGSIAYCPRGPLSVDSDAALVDRLISELAAVARRERILYVKVQPPVGRADIEPLLLGSGFARSALPAAPTATVRVDLARDQEEILAGMRAGTRANIRKAKRNGIVVREAGFDGLAAFGDLLADTSRRQGFDPYPLDYYADILKLFGADGRAELLLAEHDGAALSGALIVGYGDTVIYKMGVWSGERSRLRPNELMHWRAMQWARERGYRYYDLEGISDPVARAIVAGSGLPEEGTSGTTHFKLGLGGEVELYPGAYDRSFHPLLVWPARVVAPRLDRFRSVAGRVVGREAG